MSIIDIPNIDFVLHPVGRFTGRITEMEDRGETETMYGTKLKLSIKLECDSTADDDGTKYVISKWFTISGHPKSSLVQFRIMMLGRALTPGEAASIDPEELVGKRCGYLVGHTERDGSTYANIEQLWPVDPSPTNDSEDLPF